MWCLPVLHTESSRRICVLTSVVMNSAVFWEITRRSRLTFYGLGRVMSQKITLQS
jgi:hypothetical protein